MLNPHYTGLPPSLPSLHPRNDGHLCPLPSLPPHSGSLILFFFFWVLHTPTDTLLSDPCPNPSWGPREATLGSHRHYNQGISEQPLHPSALSSPLSGTLGLSLFQLLLWTQFVSSQPHPAGGGAHFLHRPSCLCSGSSPPSDWPSSCNAAPQSSPVTLTLPLP